MNGVKVLTLDDYSAHGSPVPSAQVVLESGPNELLVKTTDGGGGWGFLACVEGEEVLSHRVPGASA